MKKIRILLTLLACILMSAIAIAAETRGLSVIAKDSVSGKQAEVKLYNKTYAVIIGIDRYQNLPADRQLKNAVKDAKGVEEILRKSYQFDRIITLHNEQATKDRIMEVLTEELPAQMGRNDALLLFWAGHGNQEKSDYGEIGYLIPYDGATDKIRKNLTMAEIRDTVSKKIPAKHVFYVMDACYSGLLTTRSVDGKTRRDLSYLKEITKESARQVLTAGGKGEEALDGGPKGYSVFTGRLIEILESAPDFITANELQASIREKVHSDASARNHTQTPGYGALYGLGDFVFITRQQDRLGNLTGTSASRQKELVQLRLAEQEANAAKKREQEEIAKKEKELAVLDKQIADMKGRIGTSAANKDDSLDQIVALAEQKEEQGKRLEALHQQREAEEQKRQQEIARLKHEALEKRNRQIKTDLAKYQRVASSQYAGELKDAAWKAMLDNYPEAKQVEVGDVEMFLVALSVGKTDRQRMLDTFIAYDNGTVLDTKTNLMWAAKDNGSIINWMDAKTYCENYNVGGVTGWRMPTQDELAGLYESGAHKDKINISGRVWASDTSGSDAANYSFYGGGRNWNPQSYDFIHRALPVRNAK
ncbi:MAG: caspase family protein [Syntrophus sp. (in: bacteria)]